MTKNRIVKYVANTALLAVLAAAGIGAYQIGTYTPEKKLQEEIPSDTDINGRCGCQSGGLRNF